jgi:hypothetical protein
MLAEFVVFFRHRGHHTNMPPCVGAHQCDLGAASPQPVTDIPEGHVEVAADDVDLEPGDSVVETEPEFVGTFYEARPPGCWIPVHVHRTHYHLLPAATWRPEHQLGHDDPRPSLNDLFAFAFVLPAARSMPLESGDRLEHGSLARDDARASVLIAADDMPT